MAFKTLSAQQEKMQYEMFTMLMKYCLEGIGYDYRKENEELRIKLASLTVVVREYEEKFSKLFKSQEERMS